MKCDHGWDIEGVMLDIYSRENAVIYAKWVKIPNKPYYQWREFAEDTYGSSSKRRRGTVPDKTLRWFGVPAVIKLRSDEQMRRWAEWSDLGVSFDEFVEFMNKWIKETITKEIETLERAINKTKDVCNKARV